MLTVNAPRFKMFFTVLWPPLKYIAMRLLSATPPQAAFIALGALSSP